MTQPWWQRAFAWLRPASLVPPVVFLSDRLPEIAQRPILERCAIIYRDINLKPFLMYRQTDGHGHLVTVAHPTIDACIQDIISHIRSIDGLGYIDQTRQEYSRLVKPINRFFLTREGQYLPSVYDTLKSLCDVVVELCDRVEAGRDGDYYSYNLRMLNALLFVLYNFGLHLNDLSESMSLRS